MIRNDSFKGNIGTYLINVFVNRANLVAYWKLDKDQKEQGTKEAVAGYGHKINWETRIAQ